MRLLTKDTALFCILSKQDTRLYPSQGPEHSCPALFGAYTQGTEDCQACYAGYELVFWPPDQSPYDRKFRPPGGSLLCF